MALGERIDRNGEKKGDRRGGSGGKVEDKLTSSVKKAADSANEGDKETKFLTSKAANLASEAQQLRNNDEGLVRENKSPIELGWLEGYNFIYKDTTNDFGGPTLVADPNKAPVISARNPQNPTERISYMPTRSEENFKYGLEESIADFLYEDPTFLGFDILFMTTAGDFHNGLFANGINSAEYFLRRYVNLPSIKNRIPLLIEFRKVFRKLFYLANDPESYNSANSVRNKNYYLQTLAGLDKLNAKITKYKEDKITVTLHEDVAMYTLYLAELYNNIAFDYKNQRTAIPENCLRFDMMIKISDIRNFRIPFEQSSQGVNPGASFANNIVETQVRNKTNLTNDNIQGKAIDYFHQNISNQIYVLRDCNFDFSKSQNHGTEVTIGGFNASTPSPANLSFDIYFKSIERELSPLLLELVEKGAYRNLRNKKSSLYEDRPDEIPNYYLFNDKRTNREIVEEENTVRTRSTTQVTSGVFPSTGGASEVNENKEQGWWTSATDKLKDSVTKIGTDMKNTVAGEIDSYKNKLLVRWRQFRGELINNLLGEIRADLNIPEIYPNNVYEEDFYKISLENFAKSLGTGLYNDVEEGIRGGVNDLFLDVEDNLDNELDNLL